MKRLGSEGGERLSANKRRASAKKTDQLAKISGTGHRGVRVDSLFLDREAT